jgi:hypothetical protein
MYTPPPTSAGVYRRSDRSKIMSRKCQIQRGSISGIPYFVGKHNVKLQLLVYSTADKQNLVLQE